MGGAWAYEALSFGGYWAWDPVENMSLVPWIMLVAGLHTNMIARATHRAIGTTYLYYLLALILTHKIKDLRVSQYDTFLLSYNWH